MSQRPYGRIPRGGKKASPVLDSDVTVTIHGTFTLEGLSRELEIMIAKLIQRKAHGVRNCRVIFEPVDGAGEPIALWSDDGRPVTRFALNPPPAPPVFSDKA